MNMLQFTLDDSDQEEPSHPGIIPAAKYPAVDRFQSKTVTRSLFASNENDEQEYEVMVIPRIAREGSKKEKGTAIIKMINEIDYESE
jgi:hypothetical protein